MQLLKILPPELIQYIFLLSLNSNLIFSCKYALQLSQDVSFKIQWVIYKQLSYQNNKQTIHNGKESNKVHPLLKSKQDYQNLITHVTEEMGIYLLNHPDVIFKSNPNFYDLRKNIINDHQKQLLQKYYAQFYKQFMDCLVQRAINHRWETFMNQLFMVYKNRNRSKSVLNKILSIIGFIQALTELLISSCQNGDLDTIQKLIQNDCVDIHSNNDAALGIAAKYGNEECVSFLLQYSADVNSNSGFALCWASKNGYNNVVKTLFEYGSNVHVDGDKPLKWAVEANQPDIVQLLLSHGADIHIEYDYPLRWSCYMGYTNIVRTLLENGADTNTMNQYALKHAIKGGFTSIVELLLQNGANLSELDPNELDKQLENHTELKSIVGRHI